MFSECQLKQPLKGSGSGVPDCATSSDQSDLEAYKKVDRERKTKRGDTEPDELEQIHKRGKIATRKW